MWESDGLFFYIRDYLPFIEDTAGHATGMRSEVLHGGNLTGSMAGETPLQVLKELERRPQTKSYMWVFHTGEYDKKQIVLFHYSPTRAGDTAKEFTDV